MTTSRRRLCPQSGRPRMAVQLEPEAEPLVELVAAGGGLVLKIACAARWCRSGYRAASRYPMSGRVCAVMGLSSQCGGSGRRPAGNMYPGRRRRDGVVAESQAASGQRSRMRSSATAAGTNTRVRQETI